MTVTVVKGLLQPLAAERNRSTYANSQTNQAQASKNAASAATQGSDAVVMSLRSSTSQSVDRPAKGKPIENEQEAKTVADEVASGIRSDKDGEGLGAHKLSGSSEKSLA